MKKITIISLLVCFGLVPVFGQKFVEEGTMLFSGSISYYGGKEKIEYSGTAYSDNKISEFRVSPIFQYFIIDDLGIGILVNGTFESSTPDGGTKNIDNHFTFGPVARYYVHDAFFVQGYFGFGSAKSGSTDSEFKEKITEWILNGGYSVRITDTVLLDPMVGYWMRTEKDKGDSGYKATISRFCISVGFTILINK